MNTHPPVLGDWLLRQFDSSESNEALAGDLFEELREGRSVAWYWRQDLMATSVSFLNVVREHKMLAIRAIAVGSVFSYLWLHLVGQRLAHSFGMLVLNLGFRPGVLAHGYPLIPLICLHAALTGWIVGRLHRPYQASMVLAYVGFSLLWSPGHSVNALEVSRLAFDSIGNYGRFSSYLWFALTRVVLIGIITSLGGLCSATLPSPRRIFYPVQKRILR